MLGGVNGLGWQFGIILIFNINVKQVTVQVVRIFDPYPTYLYVSTGQFLDGSDPPVKLVIFGNFMQKTDCSSVKWIGT